MKATTAPVMIVHGKGAFERLLDLLIAKGFEVNQDSILSKCYNKKRIKDFKKADVKDLENNVPAFEIKMGERSFNVFVIRHFSRFGYKSASVQNIKNKILKVL